LERPKIVASAVYEPTLVAVDGNYDDVNRLASELAGEHEDWAFVNVNVRPYYAEGSKTLGFEVAEQLGWRLPSQVVIPVASGAQLVKVDKAFGELLALGLVDGEPPRIYGAQAAGCNPVAAAFKTGHDVVRPVRPDTIAKSLAIGNPAEGIFAETAGGVTIAVLAKLLREGLLDPDAETVVFNTGQGLKTLDAVTTAVGPTVTIPPTTEAFHALEVASR
jgi:threonine synthase